VAVVEGKERISWILCIYKCTVNTFRERSSGGEKERKKRTKEKN